MRERADPSSRAMVEAAEHRPDYERSDIDPRLIALLAAGVAVFLVVAPYVLLGTYPSSRHEPNPPAADTPPAPNLQINANADLRTLRAAERAQLTSYGWVDRPTGIVRLPIARALDLTAERGLPGWAKQ